MQACLYVVHRSPQTSYHIIDTSHAYKQASSAIRLDIPSLLASQSGMNNALQPRRGPTRDQTCHSLETISVHRFSSYIVRAMYKAGAPRTNA